MKSPARVRDMAIDKHQCGVCFILPGLARSYFQFFFWTVMSRGRRNGPTRIVLRCYRIIKKATTRHRLDGGPSKAVKQYYFEPAHNAGRNVPGEFTYIDDSGSSWTRLTMRYKGMLPYLVVVVVMCIFAACSRQEDKQPVRSEKRLNVVSTVAPITSIVENIGGDKIVLTGIIPEGINSHTFEPVPSDVKLFAQAHLLIANGLDLEIPTMSLARASMKKGAALLLLGDKTISEKEYIYDFSFPKERGHPNPHLWLNPQHTMRYATLIRDELIRLDPNNKSAYEAHATAFLKKLELLDQAILDSVKTIPENNRRLLTYHDSWPYFARRYGFQIIGAVQPSDFSDPSPREVMRLIDQIRKEKVPAVFGSEVFPSTVLEQIAREGKTRYIDKLRDDELPGKPGNARHSYLGMMIENLSIMFEALGGSAEALKKVDPSPVAGSQANYRRKD